MTMKIGHIVGRLLASCIVAISLSIVPASSGLAEDFSLGQETVSSTPVTIVYEVTDDSVEGYMDPQAIEADGSVELAPCAFVRPGYHFAGWMDEHGGLYADGATVYASEVGSDLLILYPHWIPNTSVIVFDAAGGTVDPTSVICTYGEAVLLPTPTWLGHTFGGWVTDLPSLSPDTRIFDIGTMPPASDGSVFNFTATWSASLIAASFDPAYPEGAGEVSAPVMLEYGVSEITLPSPTCEGYVFLGWMVRDGRVLSPGTYGSADVLGNDASSIVLVGEWRRSAYTLSYDLAGGVLQFGDMEFSNPPDDVLDVGSHIVVPSPVRMGYVFVGWQDEAGNVHLPGSVIDSLASEDGAHVTLTALWELDPDAQQEQAKPDEPSDGAKQPKGEEATKDEATKDDGNKTDEKKQSDEVQDAKTSKAKDGGATGSLPGGGVAIPVSSVPQGPFEDVLPPVEDVRDDSRIEVIVVLLGAIASSVLIVCLLRLLDSRKSAPSRR